MVNKYFFSLQSKIKNNLVASAFKIKKHLQRILAEPMNMAKHCEWRRALQPLGHASVPRAKLSVHCCEVNLLHLNLPPLDVGVGWPLP